MMKEKVEVLIIPKGTTIKIGGVPFTLKEDTKVYGLKINYELVIQGKICT